MTFPADRPVEPRDRPAQAARSESPSAGYAPAGTTTGSTQHVLIVVGATLVAVVAMAASATTLADLGHAVGWGRVLAWSLPVAVDVLALVAGLAWLAGGAGRVLGRSLTLISVAVSVVLNSLGHLVSTGHVQAGSGLVIGVSAVPPLAAALAVHLGATVLSDRTEQPTMAVRSTGTPARPADQIATTPAAPDRWHVRMAGPDHPRTTDRTKPPAPADHDTRTAGPRPDTAPDHAPVQTTPAPRTADQTTRTRKTPGRTAGDTTAPTDRAQADDAADHGSPAPDHTRSRHPHRGPDHSPRTTDRPSDADHDAQTPDQRTTPAADHANDAARHTRTKDLGDAADQGDDVPWDVVTVARQAALAEGRMTRRAIRPHLRSRGISVSNENFAALQAHLYTDPALAHLPRPPRKNP
ncbi:DUF2637 domain-containing protein [Actinacidiphila sp. bgisy144]|uniref:DUF2637 domain-containing protein n=1 Tax=Actinacidiphila sp. bgisy144 TaxID=3413791 RepID=UPI003EBC67AE